MAIKRNDPTLEIGNVSSTNPTAGVDPMDRAIPGQSLTDEPGKWGWEKPATIDTPQEAIDFAINRLTNDENTYKRTIELLASGVAVEAMTKTLVFTMFTSGMITADLAEIIQPYIFFFLMGMARDQGITPLLFSGPQPEKKPVFNMMNEISPTEPEKLQKQSRELEGEVEPEKMPEKVQAFMKLKNERGVK